MNTFLGIVNCPPLLSKYLSTRSERCRRSDTSRSSEACSYRHEARLLGGKEFRRGGQWMGEARVTLWSICVSLKFEHTHCLREKLR